MTWVKICGMTNLEDALVAVEAGADAVGFVFYEQSPRNVTVETARRICEKLTEKVEKVGIFVNEAPARVSAIADEVGLTAVQFHGDEHQNPEMFAIDHKSFYCIPADRVATNGREKGKAFGSFMVLPKNLAGVILDSGSTQRRGGTGKTFDWTELKPYASLTRTLYPLVVAGGLTSENVSEAMEVLRPWGVDVVSGVESAPGKKDPEKVRAFVRAVREMDRKAG
jgi:phosphoribosylanthranilate isomerase